MQDILFPAPRFSRLYQRRFDFSHAQWICIDSCFSENLKSQVIHFARLIGPNFAKPITVAVGPPQHGPLFLKLDLVESGIPAQGYELTSNEWHHTTCDEAGTFYGLETLRQLFDYYGVRMPRFRIAVSDFSVRSVMLDISRCKVPTLETLKATLI